MNLIRQNKWLLLIAAVLFAFSGSVGQWVDTATDAPGRRIIPSSIANRIGLSGPSELTITNSGNISVGSASFYTVGTASNSASDNLGNITGGNTGQVLILTASLGNETVVVLDGDDNIQLSAGIDFSLDSGNDTITLIYNGSYWLELSQGNNSS